jgi:hypothetical protein
MTSRFVSTGSRSLSRQGHVPASEVRCTRTPFSRHWHSGGDWSQYRQPRSPASLAFHGGTFWPGVGLSPVTRRSGIQAHPPRGLVTSRSRAILAPGHPPRLPARNRQERRRRPDPIRPASSRREERGGWPVPAGPPAHGHAARPSVAGSPGPRPVTSPIRCDRPAAGSWYAGLFRSDRSCCPSRGDWVPRDCPARTGERPSSRSCVPAQEIVPARQPGAFTVRFPDQWETRE